MVGRLSYSLSSSPLEHGGVKLTSSESRERFACLRADAFLDGVADIARTFESRDLTPLGGGVAGTTFVSTTFSVSTSFFLGQQIEVL